MFNVRNLILESARLIANATRNPLPISVGMGQWFDYCDKVAPDGISLWTRLRHLDYEADADRLTKWLTDLFATEPPSSNINGLWFGLFNPVLAGKPTCQMYVSGSSTFHPESESNEWVCQHPYWPKGRYSKSRILTDLYRSVEAVTKNDVNYLGEAFLCHGYLALLVSNWCHGPMRETLLGDASVRAVVIGHDNGDFYRMAVLRTGQ